MKELDQGNATAEFQAMKAAIVYKEKTVMAREACLMRERELEAESGKILKAAFEDYERIKKIYAWEYEKKEKEARLEYEKIKRITKAEYQRARRAAKDLSIAEYVKAMAPAQAEYNKAERDAYEKCLRKTDEASEEYNKKLSRDLFSCIRETHAAKSSYQEGIDGVQSEYKRTSQGFWRNLELCLENEGSMEEYYQESLKAGLRTAPLDRGRATELIKELYREMGKGVPSIVFSCSPLDCLSGIVGQSAIHGINKMIETGGRGSFEDELDFETLQKREKQKITIGGRDPYETASFNIRMAVERAIDRKIKDHIRSRLYNRLESAVFSQFTNLMEPLTTQANYWWFGNNYCNWAAYYGFYHDVFGFKPLNEKLFHVLKAVTVDLHWFLPFDDLCVISDFPEEICLNMGRFHKDGGPAVRYRDGFSAWALNGVRVTRKIAETPAEDLDSHMILRPMNNDVRREIVRKIGIERICRDFKAKTIDREGNYELLLLDVARWSRLPYLKMINPSIGVYHIEGVPPDITSVKQALVWRNQSEEVPDQIT
jgi:hypothetical protein